MFRSYQIMTGTKLIKNFAKIVKDMRCDPQAIFIITKSKDNMVLLNAELYEELLDNKLNQLDSRNDFKSDFSE